MVAQLGKQHFLKDWGHKCLKNTIDLLLFYREHFYGFWESDLRKCRKKIHFTTNMSICMGHKIFKFFEVLLQKAVIMLKFLHIHMKHSQYWEMRKNNSKLNFTKHHQASWFSRGWLKISKCSISLARLGES